VDRLAADLSGLRAPERDRLERFADTFDRLDASQYITLADARPSEAVEAAQAEAVRLVGTGARRTAVKAAIRAFTDEAAQAYSSRMALPDTFLLFQSLPDRAEDRVRFIASVERVVVALILWDELGEQHRSALLGLWGNIVEAPEPDA